MRISEDILRRSLLPLITMLFLLLSVSPSLAKDKKQASGGEDIRVLANLPLKDMQVNQMFVQEWGNKTYLYLHRAAEDVYALVDITNPAKPSLISSEALKGTAPEGSVGGSPLAITATQEGKLENAAAKELPTQTINFVDTSDPKHLNAVKTFKGVTSMYSDSARKLVFLVNGDGLWVIRHSKPLPVCTGDPAELNCPAIPGGGG